MTEEKKRGPERPADYDRLPARFRKYIDALESELRAFRQAQLSQTKSRISIQPIRLHNGTEQAATYLPEGEAVRFRLGDMDHDIEVRLANDAQRIEVRGWRQLRCYPKSGNEVQIDESDNW